METEYAVEVKNLTKKYCNFALDNISFQIPKGSIVGFVGENGAGKSTTIRAMLGLAPIEAGKITIWGHDVGKEKTGDWKEQVGVVLDQSNFPKELKIRELRQVLKNIYKTWDDKKFEDCLDRFRLPLEKKVKDLSKGMGMKLSIAAALSHDSRVLILDEATSGLDPVIRNEILDLFREFTLEEERAVLLSSHITSDIEKIADYIMLIHKGQILLFENKDDLLYRYGMVKCTKEQAERIPQEVIAGREDHAFGVNVLIKDREKLTKSGFFQETDEITPVIDRVSIEDVLVYLVRMKEAEL